MTKFARQVNGTWRDPKEAASLASLDTQYHPDWVLARKAAGEWFQPVSDVIYDVLVAHPTPSSLAPHDDGAEQFTAIKRARARTLANDGKFAEAVYELLSIGE